MLLSIKPKTVLTNILEDSFPPTTIYGHFNRCRKTIVSELPAVLDMKTVSAYHFYDVFSTLCFYFPLN